MKVSGVVRVVVAVLLAFVFTSVVYYTFTGRKHHAINHKDNHVVFDPLLNQEEHSDKTSRKTSDPLDTTSTIKVPFLSPQTPHSPAVQSIGVTEELFNKNMVNRLNYDVWRCRQYVGFYVDDMRIREDWPNHPMERSSVDSLLLDLKHVNNFAAKMYGYLLVQQEGDYILSLNMRNTTAAVGAELWLSNNTHPHNMSKIVVLEYTIRDRHHKRPHTTIATSTPISLKKNAVYYIEVHVKTFDGSATIEAMWQPPSSPELQPLSNYHLAMAVELDGNRYSSSADPRMVKILQGNLPSNKLQTHHYQQFVTDEVVPTTDLNVLPDCEFKPEYVRARKVKTYTGIYAVFESFEYPPDPTFFNNHKKPDRGNNRIPQITIDKVMSQYVKAFNASYKGKVTLRYLEETQNKGKGSRFLLETDINMEDKEEVVHTSEYVYLSDKLCHTSNFQWKRDVDVHVIVSVKDLSPWIRHLIHNVEYIYTVTRDKNFQLIIVDYDSSDLDIENELSQSILPRWKVLKKKGKFSRSAGLQAGIDYIQDVDSIVMTIDMHLNLPPNFIDAARKHTVQGKMAYTPMFFRLNPGYTEINVDGFWETLTYGLIGMYKSDWIRTKGFNVVKYKHKWGGEDWDALDKVIAKGIEAFRIRPPGLVHYFHSKANMWGGHKKTDGC